jgi:hypothetical protein
MDLSALIVLYPVAKDMIDKMPQARKWMEKAARKEEPSLFLQLELKQFRFETASLVEKIREEGLINAITAVLLANPDLTEDEISNRILKARVVGRKVLKNLKSSSQN